MDFIGTKVILIISVTLLVQGYLLDAIGIRRYPIDLYENEFCGLNPEVYSGKCKKLKNCMHLLHEKKDIEVCSFGYSNRGDETLVCCSRDDFYKSRKYNRDGILDYNTCANKYKNLREIESSNFQAFAINGVDVGPYEFSHIAAIGWFQLVDFSIEWNCAGNLITENFVMSAAHCMMLDQRKPNVVRLGDVDLNSEEDNHNVQQFYVYRIFKHPAYNYDTNENDIALIQLRGSVVPTMNVVPACLNSGQIKTEYFEGGGYGQDENNLRSNKLSKVYLKLVEMETCKKSYELPLSIDSQICALGYRDDLPVQDLCYGDSGSALQYMSSDFVEDETIYKIPTLVAITSFGIGCAFGFPSVYVNISHYLHWMESVISP